MAAYNDTNQFLGAIAAGEPEITFNLQLQGLSIEEGIRIRRALRAHHTLSKLSLHFPVADVPSAEPVFKAVLSMILQGVEEIPAPLELKLAGEANWLFPDAQSTEGLTKMLERAKLKTLELSNVRFSSDALGKLMSCLESNRTLTALALINCNFTRDFPDEDSPAIENAGKLIADMMRQNTTINVLNLAGNGFNDSPELLTLLQNTTITDLNLETATFPDECMAAFSQLLKHNKTLLKLNLFDFTHIPPDIEADADDAFLPEHEKMLFDAICGNISLLNFQATFYYVKRELNRLLEANYHVKAYLEGNKDQEAAAYERIVQAYAAGGDIGYLTSILAKKFPQKPQPGSPAFSAERKKYEHEFTSLTAWFTEEAAQRREARMPIMGPNAAPAPAPDPAQELRHTLSGTQHPATLLASVFGRYQNGAPREEPSAKAAKQEDSDTPGSSR